MGRVLLSTLGIWLSLGAATALFELEALTGSTLVLWRDLPIGAHHEAWRRLSGSVAVISIAASLIAAAVPRLSRLVASVCLGVSIGLAIASLVAQYPALNFTIHTHAERRRLGGLAIKGLQRHATSERSGSYFGSADRAHAS